MGVESEIYGLNQSLAQDQPFYLSMLESLPSAWTTTGWNIGRVSNTMLAGNRMKSLFPTPNAGLTTGGWSRNRLSITGHRQGILQTFSPRNFTRLRSPSNIDPTGFGPNSRIYTPFNALSTAGNFLFKKRDATNIPGIGSKANSYLAKASGSLAGQLGTTDGAAPFSPGTLGRIAGIDKITRMSDAKYAAKSGNMLQALAGLNVKTNGVFSPLNPTAMTAQRFAMGSEFGSTITGTYSGRAAGYIHGARAASVGSEALTGASRGYGAFGKGVTEGAEAFAKGSKLAKAATYAGPALRAVSVAANVMLVHDLALMAGRGVGAIVKTGTDAITSAKGSIDKPIMGMGFKDNSVAATSRQRGVMAIQNSQLNARSILGSEAAMLHARFG